MGQPAKVGAKVWVRGCHTPLPHGYSAHWGTYGHVEAQSRADAFRPSAQPLTPLSLHCAPGPPPVLRCLGIPTRVVTNYNSAHDQNSNLLIEYFRNEFGEIEGNKSEMIW